MSNRFIRCLLFLAAIALAGPAAAQSSGPGYTFDILSKQFYPQLKDAWMFRINNQGVAAGYIATDKASGPYLPATFSGGKFQTYGLQSSIYQQSVTGLNDRGDIVGTLFDKDYNQTPYIVRNGVASFPAIPANFYPSMYGINYNGLAYGSYFDDAAGLVKIFTVSGDAVTPLDLHAPGFNSFDSGPRSLTNSGLLGVIGYSDDFSIQRGFLENLTTGRLTELALPDGQSNFFLSKVTESGLVFGYAASADGSTNSLGEWGRDGTFLHYIDLPTGVSFGGVLFNDLGQAITLADGRLMFYDGSIWTERTLPSLDGYTLASISDFNDRGDFVGLVHDPNGSFEWGFVAHAVPEPGSITLLLFGLVGAPLMSRRLRRYL